MKAIITKQEVAKAIDSLKATGKKPTLQAIHAVLGNKGSLSTVQKFRSEIEADTVTEQDSEEGLQVFRQLWAAAVQEGKTQKEAECGELREALDAMAAESEQASGELVAAQGRVAEIEAQRDGLISDLAKASEQVTVARAAGEQAASKLAASLERITELQTGHAAELTSLRSNHADETATLRTQLAASEKQAHETALTLARAEAKLNSTQERVAEVERQRDSVAGDLAKASEQVAVARAAGEQAASKLAASLERIAQLQTVHASELAEVRKQLAASEKHAHELEMKLAHASEKPESSATGKKRP